MKVAMIGFGTVGSGAYEILMDRKEQIERAMGEAITVSHVMVPEAYKHTLPEEVSALYCSDYEEVLSQVDAIVEVTGTHDAAYEYITRALENHVAVVTANKAVVSAHFEEFQQLAEEKGTAFLFEAAVGGGIPVLTPLRELLLTNEVTSLYGILNGTCNFLLNKMFDEGSDYGETLKTAQELGFAEKDPTDDVEGFDTMRKLRILTTMAMGEIHEEDILLRGISQMNKEVVDHLKSRGQKVKLVAYAQVEEGVLSALVEPLILPETHPLGALPHAINTVRLSGNWVGDIAFEGPGAGKEPTGNAIVADLIDVCKYGGYPLLKKPALPIGNDHFKGKYLIYRGELPSEYIDYEEDNFLYTKEMDRAALMEFVKEDTFFARIEE